VSTCRRSGSTKDSRTASWPSVASESAITSRSAKRVAVRVLAGAHVVDAVEPLAHQAELLTVRLVGVALARLLDDRREPFDVGRQRLGEPVVDRVSLAVLTQHGREPLAAVAVLLDGDLALARQRLVGDLRRDERVAVAVGARPRAELEELGAVHVVVLLRDGLLELLVGVAHDIEESVFEVPLNVSCLVFGLRAPLAHLSGAPEAGHLGGDVAPDRVPLALGEVALVERFEVVGNRSELRLHGGSPGLGGVGGERRLDEYVR